jgi:deoxyxylulose-5-phosphate synthase
MPLVERRGAASSTRNFLDHRRRGRCTLIRRAGGVTGLDKRRERSHDRTRVSFAPAFVALRAGVTAAHDPILDMAAERVTLDAA